MFLIQKLNNNKVFIKKKVLRNQIFTVKVKNKVKIK